MKKIIISAIFIAVAAVYCSATVFTDHDQALIQEAMSNMDNGNPESARAVLDSLATVYVNDVDLSYERALATKLCGDSQGCIAIIEEIISTKGDEINAELGPQYFSLLATAYYDLGNLDKSNEVLEDAINSFPHEGILYRNYGTNKYVGGDSDGALKTFMKGVEMAPEWKSNYIGALQLLLEKDAKTIPILLIAGYALIDPQDMDAMKLGAYIPELLHKMIGRNEENGNIMLNIGKDTEYTAPDLFLSLALASEFSKTKDIHSMSNDVEALILVSAFHDDLPDTLPVAVADYLSLMKRDNEDLLRTFWTWLVSSAYPMEIQDWLEANPTKLSALSDWLSAHPYIETLAELSALSADDEDEEEAFIDDDESSDED